MGAAIAAVLWAAGLASCGDEDGSQGSAGEPTRTVALDPGPPEPEQVAQPEDEDEDERPGDDGDRPAEQREQPLSVEDVTTAVLTRSGTPEQGCAELVTDRFVTDAYGDRRGCLAAREAGGLARSLAKAVFRENGERATGTVVPEGGPYDGIEVEVQLVSAREHDGGWLVDSLLADVPAGP